jgi:hypothetical protein
MAGENNNEVAFVNGSLYGGYASNQNLAYN